MNEASCSYSTRMWRLLYPILTFIGIFYVFEMLATILAMAFSVVAIKNGGGALDYTVLMEQTMLQLDNFSYEINLIAAICTIPLEILYMKRDRIRWGRTVPVFDRVPVMTYLIAPVLGAAACLAINNMLEISGAFRMYSEDLAAVTGNMYRGRYLVEILYIVIFSPILEELMFRGVIQRRIRALGRVETSIVISALLFSCYHGTLLTMIYAGLLGLILAYCFEKYQNLAAPILIHIGANLVSFIGSETGVLDFLYEEDGILFAGTAVWCGIVFVCLWMVNRLVNAPVIRRSEEEHREAP